MSTTVIGAGLLVGIILVTVAVGLIGVSQQSHGSQRPEPPAISPLRRRQLDAAIEHRHEAGRCAKCGGSGAFPFSAPRWAPCPECGGSGAGRVCIWCELPIGDEP